MPFFYACNRVETPIRQRTVRRGGGKGLSLLGKSSAPVQLRMGLGGVDPGVDSNVEGKDHGSDTNHSKSNINSLSLPGLGTGFVMEQGWEDEAEGHAGHASDERDKDIQGRATNS